MWAFSGCYTWITPPPPTGNRNTVFLCFWDRMLLPYTPSTAHRLRSVFDVVRPRRATGQIPYLVYYTAYFNGLEGVRVKGVFMLCGAGGYWFYWVLQEYVFVLSSGDRTRESMHIHDDWLFYHHCFFRTWWEMEVLFAGWEMKYYGYMIIHDDWGWWKSRYTSRRKVNYFREHG